MAGVGGKISRSSICGNLFAHPYSEDARVAVDVLRGRMPGTPKPDAFCCFGLPSSDAPTHARPAGACCGLPTLVLLNMSDLMESRGGKIDVLKLARELDAPWRKSAPSTAPDRCRSALSHQQNGHAQAKRVELPSSATRPARTTGPRRSAAHRYQARSRRQHAQDRQCSAASHLGPLLFLLVVFGVFEWFFRRPAALRRLRRPACPRCRFVRPCCRWVATIASA